MMLSTNFKWVQHCPKRLVELEDQIFYSLSCGVERQKVHVGEEQWIYYCKTGSGPPLVMLHGFASAIPYWLGNYEELSKHFTIYAVDLPGFGRSSRTPFKGKTVQEAEDYFILPLEVWIKKLELTSTTKISLLAHSFGGYIAGAWSLRSPHLFNRIIFVDPWGFNRVPTFIDARYRLFLFFYIKAFSGAPIGNLLRFLGPLGSTVLALLKPTHFTFKYHKWIPGDSTILRDYFYHVNSQPPYGEMVISNHLGEHLLWAKKPLIDRFDKLDSHIKISFIYGEKTWMDKEPANEIMNKLGDERIDIHEIPLSGHQCYGEQPSYYNSVVLSILLQDEKMKRKEIEGTVHTGLSPIIRRLVGKHLGDLLE